MTTLVWHRRDLRTADNPALARAVARGGPIIPVFVLDPEILQREDTGPIRVQFLLDSLRVLAQRYQQLGGNLIVRIGDPVQILPKLAEETGATALHFNADVEPFALQRDTRVRTACETRGILVQGFQEICLETPQEILSGQGKPYSVFGPFWRNWVNRPKQTPYPTPERIETPVCSSQPIPTLEDLRLSIDQPPVRAGEEEALARLDEFCAPHLIFNYSQQRNLPAIDGTSRLSPHLRMGTLGIRTVWQRTIEMEEDAYSEERTESLTAWRQELCWRDFYKYTLWHFPQVETAPYQRKFTHFAFNDNPEHFERWCQGETGYPLVDAAMTQLNQTGWMHNRCRMVVASFLTKDLLIDWRKGERYFMQKLVCGDLSANNGGWQWSASMGTDPKPLRIFNPQTQLARFDPEGTYVRHWLPALTAASLEELMLGKNLHRYGYPQPIVDHKRQQEIFKQRYSTHRSI
ncbi:cryptochrome/photolyase family protein [Anthocerotibacter panamensis]|uniref:cryptochrome/photolyase family protein n=1 Tax=Anthocerotibacter panamensis TaxID=2857077 RepID=UPI001C40645E|nr:deoxyribodipyrimidine photo-lyase [Anthocerotibacter panamensis]